LVDRDLYEKRRDLIYTGRTLFGIMPPKGQELSDHYFGTIKQRVSDYMKDLDKTLWELGIPSKTKHNEVAPSQHESAPVFESANLAADHNQLTMELMQKIAKKHGYVALLHEKPFEGINGSGKHDNWSLSTDTGLNLLEPGSSPIENAQFLTFLAAVVAAVDEYSDLLRLSVASAGNDHRLGANEAPPAVVSVFLGEELTDVIDALINDREVRDLHQQFDVGVTALPKFAKDTTDRNRTSPFAFTGNKFEFRMVGSNLNITGPNIILNTIVAETLSRIADRLEEIIASGEKSLREPLRKILVETFTAHKNILFNGNGYDNEWINEASKRGLLNLPGTADSVPYFKLDKNVEVFVKHKVFSKTEILSRLDITLDTYCKAINIEALTAIDIAQKEILPAAFKFQKQLYELLITKKAAGFEELDVVNKKSGEIEQLAYDRSFATYVDGVVRDIVSSIANIKKSLNSFDNTTDLEQVAYRYQNKILPSINDLREKVDALEAVTPKELWPVPTYGELLFSVK
ncbi:MAG: glutamine synthetase type III, partial [Oscillospiraceae bacterium]|nr:glutamine synthetase type III [Oscillospiraceae bacterium]